MVRAKTTRNARLGAVVVALIVAAPDAGPDFVGPPTADTTLAQETPANDSTDGDAAVTFEDQSSNGSAVVVNATNLSEGGFVAVFAQNGTLLGNSTYLEPGEHEDLTVELEPGIDRSQVLVAVPHVDTDDDEVFDFNVTEAEAAATTAQEGNVSDVDLTDRPYVADGLPVSAVAFVTVEGDGGVGQTQAENETESSS
ncbi:DUF7282 domain-containing protein [Halorussus amylolyticus]|uniref:DUF7282 domain-containing protein n=1 Tax=Halorussus amylolyticus TaxID=1126242 RepID=UPI00138F6E7F|nr:hypothetical protein [Halorussus amylolyticus]